MPRFVLLHTFFLILCKIFRLVMDKKIGILAGMGPRSTAPFLELVLDECQIQCGAKYDIDYPHIIVYSLPTPFFIDREVDNIELSNSIKQGIEHLESTDVDIIAISCNSAHKYFGEITSNITIPVLNIIDETIEVVVQNEIVTILATRLTMESHLYQDGLNDINAEYVFEDGWQDDIDLIITKIKDKEDIKVIIDMWNSLTREIAELNVGTIIIACTDLSIVPLDEIEGLRFIDSSKILAKRLVEESVKIK